MPRAHARAPPRSRTSTAQSSPAASASSRRRSAGPRPSSSLLGARATRRPPRRAARSTSGSRARGSGARRGPQPGGVAADDERLGPGSSAGCEAATSPSSGGDDGDAVALGDRLAEAAHGERQSRKCLDADRVPDGLQLEEGGDLPRALAVGAAAHDALDVVGGEPLELGARRRPRRRGRSRSRPCARRATARALRLWPVRTLTTPPGTSQVASTSASSIAASGRVSDATATTALPPTSAGARRETSPSSGGSSGARTPTTPVGSGTVKLKYGPATGFEPPSTCASLSAQPAYQTMRSIAALDLARRPCSSSANSARRASIISATR